VAEKVAAHIFDPSLAGIPRPANVKDLIVAKAYSPVYRQLN
jgi:hypothetical protein